MTTITIEALEINFPEELLETLEKKLATANPNEPLLVELHCTPGFGEALHPDSLEFFMKKFEALTASFGNTKNLSLVNYNRDTFDKDALKTLLKDKKFIDHLTEKSFLELAVLSEYTTKLMLKDSLLKDRLSSINVASDKQSFRSSCAARSVMKFLLEVGILDKKDYNAYTELEIYQKIWFMPGGIADPEKLIDYLRQFNSKVNGVIIEDVLSNTFQQNKDESLTYGFSIFEKNITNPRRNKQANEYHMPSDTLALVMVSSGLMPGGHLVFCKQLDSSRYEVTNPAQGNVHIYDSFDQFMKEQNGLGVIFELPIPSKKMEQQLDDSSNLTL